MGAPGPGRCRRIDRGEHDADQNGSGAHRNGAGPCADLDGDHLGSVHGRSDEHAPGRCRAARQRRRRANASRHRPGRRITPALAPGRRHYRTADASCRAPGTTTRVLRTDGQPRTVGLRRASDRGRFNGDGRPRGHLRQYQPGGATGAGPYRNQGRPATSRRQPRSRAAYRRRRPRQPVGAGRRRAAARVGPPGGPEPEELLKKLYDPLLRRLRTELRRDRERHGLRGGPG